MFTEDVIEFGPNKNLVGILTRPASADPSKPGVVILNSGALHRVGACRIAVELSRTLAEQGYCSFRFDLYGIGDSGFGSETEKPPLYLKTEVKEALDQMQTRIGASRFVLHGLCSGARDAFATALDDERVVGLSMVDGYAYRNLRYFINKLPTFLKSPAKWINFIRVRTLPDKTKQEDGQDSLMERPVWPDYPEKSVVETGFEKLVERKVRLLITYTGSWSGEYNYERQFEDIFPSVKFGDLLHMNFIPGANHVMTDQDHRVQLCRKLLALVKNVTLSNDNR